MRAALIAICLLLVAAPAAGAASITYVDNGEVWVSSLDGTAKARLASPVVNSEGNVEKWLAVAASDSGRIVAARNVPGRIARFSWFKVWEPNGSSTVEGPLNAPNGWSVYVYPLGFDVTADGQHMVYGYSNSGSCCPIAFARGFYVRPVTNSVLEPINVSGEEEPTIFGSRVVARQGSTIAVQDAAASTYGTTFTPWLDTAGTGLELRRTDVAATGQLAAFELEQWNGGSQTIGKIGVISINGIDQPPTFPAAVDCFVPAAGVAGEVSLSQDGTRIAWSDDQGLKVAGAPVGAADPCTLASPPVVISPTATQGSIGGADVAAFLPPAPPPGGSALPGAAGPQSPSSPGGGAAPTVTVPGKVTLKALAGKAGLPVTVAATKAGVVSVVATVPAKLLGRKGKPIVVAKGSARAKRAGKLTVKLRLTDAGRAKRKRLKGAQLTLRVTQGKLSSTKRVTVRKDA